MTDPFAPFGAMRPPSPPHELRERVLRAARAAALASARRRTLPTRWGFTRFDLAWVAALVVLVLWNLLLPSRSSRHPDIASSGSPNAEEWLLARELGLSGMQVAALASSSARPAASAGREIERQILEAM